LATAVGALAPKSGSRQKQILSTSQLLPTCRWLFIIFYLIIFFIFMYVHTRVNERGLAAAAAAGHHA
jgi:type II secretory pathway component PulF